MARYTYNFLRNEDGSIDYDHYKTKARTARYQTRAKVFRKVLVGLKRVMPALGAGIPISRAMRP